ncbi:MAG: hypothetical protein ABIH71_07610 [Candidatus Omnitrophota bacterium]|nr:hypothetical protein [Candidatus Omnitrophota bacterium]
MDRIKERVLEGGHNVPKEDVKRRFERSISNFFKTYRLLVDSWMIFNNAEIKPELVVKKDNGNIDIINEELFVKILHKAGVKL